MLCVESDATLLGALLTGAMDCLSPRHPRDHAQSDDRQQVHHSKWLTKPVEASDDGNHERKPGEHEGWYGRSSTGFHGVIEWDV